MAQIVSAIFKHNVWANDRIFSACEGLSDTQLDATVPGTFGTIRDTLDHMVRSEESYVARLAGDGPPASVDEASSDLAKLRERMRRSGQTMVAYVEEHPEDRVIEGTWRGRPFAIPASVFLAQAINHATDHRSQIATIMTQQGITPPDLDVWAYDEATRRG